MIAVGFRLPYYENLTNTGHNYVYYFDTLLTSDDGYLMPTDSIYMGSVTAFVTFNLDGNILEQKFLQIAYEDTLGNIIRYPAFVNESYERIYNDVFYFSQFTIDNEGNIIMVRYADDHVHISCDTCTNNAHTMSVANGEIGALKILVDGFPRHTWYPPYRTSQHNVQLLKFSPGFDSLLAATYFLNDSNNAYAEAFVATTEYINSIETDNEGNIYFDMMHVGFPSIPIYNSDTMYFGGSAMSCCVKYNPQLKPVKKYTIESGDYYSRYSHITPEGELYMFCTSFWIDISRTLPPYFMVYRGDTLDVDHESFWIRIDTADGRMLAYGKVPSTVESLMNGLHPQYTVANNRVFAQVRYWGSIEAPDTCIQLDEIEQRSIGLMQWDTDGHILSLKDFGAHTMNDGGSQIHLVDSIVYLTGLVFGGATFGSWQVEASDAGVAYIAIYVDTSLMHPYVYSDPRQPQYIEWEQDLTLPLTDTLVMLTATATSGLPVGYSCDDSTVALVVDGVLQPLRVGTATVTATQGGSTYGYYPAAPVTKLVTIHNVGIDDIQNSAFNIQNLSIYPNPTRGDVYIHTEGETVKKVNLYSSDGRQLPIQPQGTTVPLSPYPAGVYYLQLTTQTGTCQFKVTKY